MPRSKNGTLQVKMAQVIMAQVMMAQMEN